MEFTKSAIDFPFLMLTWLQLQTITLIENYNLNTT
jgi:hypothetical protein